VTIAETRWRNYWLS